MNLTVNMYIIKNKYQKKKINTEEGFQCFYVPTILNDLGYRKDKKYYPQVLLSL